MIEFTIPIRVISEANQREHWATKYRRKNEQQGITYLLLARAVRRSKQPFPIPATVRLVRLGAKTLDTDNLAGAFKHIQDAIAKWIDIDDGDPRVRYEYAQEPNGKREYSVRVEILPS